MTQARRYLNARVFVGLLTAAATLNVLPSYAWGDHASVPHAEASAAGLTEISSPAATSTSSADSTFDSASWSDRAIGAIDREVLSIALASAADAVERGDAEPKTLTVIDFSRRSTKPRLWVYDLRSRELLFEEHVSHGRNSGHDLATSFSNEPGSFKSSIGLYRAAEAYYGKHGYSLRLDGLEAGFNDRARERAIVIHGADYVNAKIAKAQGRLGRSLGCPAVRPEIATKLIDAVKEGGLIFAYYPDPEWLKASTYLN